MTNWRFWKSWAEARTTACLSKHHGGEPVPKTIRLSAIHANPIDTPTGVRWAVEYVLIYNPHRWYRMLPPMFNDSIEQWETELVLAYDSTTINLVTH